MFSSCLSNYLSNPSNIVSLQKVAVSLKAIIYHALHIATDNFLLFPPFTQLPFYRFQLDVSGFYRFG